MTAIVLYILLAIYILSVVAIGAYVFYHKVKGIRVYEDDPFEKEECQMKPD
jgi:K+-transporting ATPase c subunit